MLQLEERLFEALDTPEGVPTALQHAVELEHATIPTYLYALYSLEPGKNAEIGELMKVSSAYYAPSAAVATMSSTLAPRERSEQGRARPWRIGPTALAPASRSTSL